MIGNILVNNLMVSAQVMLSTSQQKIVKDSMNKNTNKKTKKRKK